MPKKPGLRERLFGRRRFLAAAAAGLATGKLYSHAASAQTPSDWPMDRKWFPSRWGAGDQAGASNFITPKKVLEAMSLVRSGKVYSLGRV